jgi:hypothetical protein
LPQQRIHFFRTIDDIAWGAYNIPFNTNFPGIDAIMPKEGEMFQMTLQKYHGVSAAILEELKQRKVFGPNPRKIQLYFVVEPGTFLKMPVQIYHGTHKEALKKSRRKVHMG